MYTNISLDIQCLIYYSPIIIHIKIFFTNRVCLAIQVCTPICFLMNDIATYFLTILIYIQNLNQLTMLYKSEVIQ